MHTCKRRATVCEHKGVGVTTMFLWLESIGTHRWKGSLRSSRSLDFWYRLISLRATVPGRKRFLFLTPPWSCVAFRAACVASCLRGALPPVDLRAVCVGARRVWKGVRVSMWRWRGLEDRGASSAVRANGARALPLPPVPASPRWWWCGVAASLLAYSSWSARFPVGAARSRWNDGGC